MSDLTEERIREIVREELADLADHMAESSVTHSAEMAVAKAAMRHHAETLMEDLHVPDDMRERFNEYMNGILE
ncbi:hypothetical protein [Mycolicibacterium fortuitum]|uniref:hypothetical protein n=1 Tax=Mycolicibacterium fortuitum TaxID=1766 RepID=UPI0007EAE193|nr:hypothetical protein [Mycolicibacterium fortuitum]OBB45677.1 hypothetical protein A5754_09110 [Mycolicibacterium fortuitum]OBB66589.1 hypothetical protein A5755_19825 [Mycolicibacterium fortuitum]OBB76268.1 hypothetical protein A5755_13190 [Mycolicibacterium fortuitum]OBF72687.1 hypothetical protein A5751_30060 [Mycolicibacterium fortuitum]